MLQNYVIIALRTLRKHLGYSLINVTGLAIGLTCFILIGLFVQFELSYDTFHEKADRIYRIEEVNPDGYYLERNRYAVTPAPMANVLMEEMPEVEHAVHLNKVSSLVEFRDNGFYENGLLTTAHFFDVFDFQLLEGDPQKALVDPFSIILTESLAKKYFGDVSAMGRMLTLTHMGGHGNGTNQMTVTGIAKDAPSNSHITFDYISPYLSSSMNLRNREDWGTSTSFTYASLQAGHSLTGFTAKLAELVKKYNDQPEASGNDQKSYYAPLPLTDIHLRSQANFELGRNGDIRYVYLFAAIAVLVLLIACINYINLTTARSATRAVEVGVRKVMGAGRMQLAGQFMSEAIVPSLLAMCVAIGLANALLPTFSGLTGRSILLNWEHNGFFLLTLILVGLGIGVLSGSYPALMMSRFHPVRMMKKQMDKTAGKTTFRNVLVIVQFSVTIMLIIGTLGIQQQLRFIEGANTGFNRDQVISVTIRDDSLHTRFDVLRQALQHHAGVLGVTASEKDPTMIDLQGVSTSWEGAREGQQASTYFMPVQHGFVDLFDIKLVEGRSFSESITSDATEGMLINESLKRQLGWETAEGKRFDFYGREARVLGVMKDFHFQTFRNEVAPLALFIEEGWFLRLFVKVRGDLLPETIADIERTMATFSPAFPFEYQLLDDAYKEMYQSDTRLGKLLSYFTFLALFIACLGLLGLATFTVQQRTKEIGVRKVLGASLSDILVLLTRDFTRLVIVAFLLAAPLGYFAISAWLGGFAYHITVGWQLFFIAGLSVLLIAWLTVSYQSLRAALANPVQSLHHD